MQQEQVLAKRSVGSLGRAIWIASSLFVCVVVVCIMWNLGTLRLTTEGKIALIFAAFSTLAFFFATAIWSLKWRRLNLQNSWQFLTGPRPADAPGLAAWKWGRRTWYCWFALLLGMLAMALT